MGHLVCFLSQDQPDFADLPPEGTPWDTPKFLIDFAIRKAAYPPTPSTYPAEKSFLPEKNQLLQFDFLFSETLSVG